MIFVCKKDSECELLHWKYVYLNDHPGSMPMHVHCRDGAALVLEGAAEARPLRESDARGLKGLSCLSRGGDV